MSDLFKCANLASLNRQVHSIVLKMLKFLYKKIVLNQIYVLYSSDVFRTICLTHIIQCNNINISI